MSSMRSTAGVAVLGGRLYAVGGRDGSVCHRSIECYDPHTNKWSLLAPMNRRRGGVGVSDARALSNYAQLIHKSYFLVAPGNCG